MLYRRSSKPTWSSFLVSPAGLLFVLSLLGLICATCVCVILFRRVHQTGGVSYWQCVGGPILGLIGIVAAGEIGLRVVAVPHWWGQEIGKLLLLPRGWNHVAQRYGAMLDRFDAEPNYFVEDARLGWTVGASRTARDGRWLSSQDGVRSRAQGENNHLTTKVPCRVAVLGDSFTFGWEETFEQTMVFFLQERLGPGCQVLNLGVPGYSIAQMYLRYERDVSNWNPNLVILSFTDGAPSRGMGVYCFLMMGDWDCPWAAPRFSLKGGRLEVINVPLPSPRSIYDTGAIYQLPFIQFDRWYETGQWEQPGWEPLYSSYLFRLATTWHPPYSPPRAEVSDERMGAIAEALFRAFTEKTASDRTPLLILYQPKKEDYLEPRKEAYSPALLRRLNIDFLDGTLCLNALSPDRRFRAGGTHYSTEGERTLADCLLPRITALLPERRPFLPLP